MRFREGDLIKDVNSIIFDVKGLVHPPGRVVAFPRFVPDTKGERKQGRVAYCKVYALSARYDLLEKRFPQYLVQDEVFGERLCEVPAKDVRRHYRPIERLQELRLSERLDALEREALDFVSLLHQTAKVPWSALGVSGSLLSKLHTIKSDIDPVVYGVEDCLKVRSAINALHNSNHSPVQPYSKKTLRILFDFRSKDTQVTFEDFVRTETRKVLQGKYHGYDYFIRCLKNWNETNEKYGDVHYCTVGEARIMAAVTDASKSIFTPCTYKIANVRFLQGNVEPITEIASFRGRFCEHAQEGEAVIAQGKLERMQNRQGKVDYRLLVGNKPSDFMILA